MRYFPHALMLLIEAVTDGEFDPQLWTDDPDLNLDARDLRDQELLLDLTGNLDAPCA